MAMDEPIMSVCIFSQLQNNDLIDIESGAFRRLPNLQTL